MPRTYASKPAYAVRYWRMHALDPVRVDTLDVIKRRADHVLNDCPPRTPGRVVLGDAARSVMALRQRFDMVITSPPYYGMRTYVADQWLRNWFLGGPPTVVYGERNLLSHESPHAFARSLAEVWDRIADRLSSRGSMFIRFGAIPSRRCKPCEIITTSLECSRFPWRICKIRPAMSAASGKRQACHMGQ